MRQNDDFFERSKIEFRIVKTMVCGTSALSEVRENEMKKLMFFVEKIEGQKVRKMTISGVDDTP